MYVHFDTRKAYLAHPHTASRSISEALMSLGWKKSRGHHYGPRPGLERHKDLEFFCVVRNHFDAFTSWFCIHPHIQEEGVITGEWIENWIKHHQGRKQSYIQNHKLWYFREEVPSTRVIRYENLDVELNNLMVEWDLPHVYLGHVSDEKRKGFPYQVAFSNEARKVVEEYFALEMEELNYVF